MAAALRVGQTKKRRLAETTTGLVEQNAAAGWHYTPAQEGRPARLTNVYTGKVEAVPRVPTAPRFHPARIAVIVPFRDLHAAQQRTSHRRAFVPFMLRYLSECKLKDFTVMLVEQSDDGRKFNRGKLLNIGFDLLKDSHDAFIFHDVDLLPGDDLRDSYSVIPATGKPIHIARCWGRYSNNPKYFGGIVSFCRGDFERLNGYPNNFWGWGGEDDELYNRLKQCGLSFVSPPTGSIADLEEMSLQEKLAFLKKNPDWKNQVRCGPSRCTNHQWYVLNTWRVA